LTEPFFRKYGTVDSTNRIAMELARSGEPEGCVVLAQSQSAGRGRNGRAWRDEPGKSILMSIVLKPNLPNDSLGRLSLAVGVGAAEGVEAMCSARIRLKWPNDLMIEDRKVGGILIETDIAQDPPCVVAGIGINVLDQSLPPDISDTATFLQAHSLAVLEIENVAQSVSEQVIAACSEMAAGHWDCVLARWRDRMWGIGRNVTVVSGEQTIAGVMSGISDAGALELKTADGSQAAILSAERITLRN